MGTMVEGGVLQVETIVHHESITERGLPSGSSRFFHDILPMQAKNMPSETRNHLKNTKIPNKNIEISNKKRTFAPLFPMGRLENYINLLFNFLILM